MNKLMEVRSKEIRYFCSSPCCDNEDYFKVVGEKVVCEDCMCVATPYEVNVTRFIEINTYLKVGEKVD